MVPITLPYNIQIELVEGCNRMCDFCGIHSIWSHAADRKIKFMEEWMFKGIANSLKDWGFNAKRVEFAMHGEPTLHPLLPQVIKCYRESLPLAQLQVTTNGIKLLEKGPLYITELFNNGLNILIVDTYVKKEEILKVLHGVTSAKLLNYYVDSYNCYHYHGNKDKVIVLMGDLGEVSGTRKARTIINHAGNGEVHNLRKYGVVPLQAPLVKKCSRPFREISVHYDGTISLCCLDWRHEAVMGKFPEEGSFEQIWNSPIFKTLRDQLYSKKRDIRPCYRCDYNGGFRLGFLKAPNKEGLLTDSEVLRHFTIYSKYCHNNAKDPIKYVQKNTGINTFFK